MQGEYIQRQQLKSETITVVALIVSTYQHLSKQG